MAKKLVVFLLSMLLFAACSPIPPKPQRTDPQFSLTGRVLFQEEAPSPDIVMQICLCYQEPSPGSWLNFNPVHKKYFNLQSSEYNEVPPPVQTRTDEAIALLCEKLPLSIESFKQQYSDIFAMQHYDDCSLYFTRRKTNEDYPASSDLVVWIERENSISSVVYPKCKTDIWEFRMKRVGNLVYISYPLALSLETDTIFPVNLNPDKYPPNPYSPEMIFPVLQKDERISEYINKDGINGINRINASLEYDNRLYTFYKTDAFTLLLTLDMENQKVVYAYLAEPENCLFEELDILISINGKLTDP